MPKIRILIVDDSVVIRRMLTDALSADPMLEIAGVAANGRIALSKIPQVNPDLVTLDIEMPEMNGLEALAELRKSYPRLPVIMFSTVTERGAAATLDALALGANDYVTKPANVGGLDIALKRVREDLIPKIKALCSPATALSMLPRPRPQFAPPPNAAKPRENGGAARLDVLAIGVSTGGPNALSELLPQLPPDFPAHIVIVQHMPPIFTRLLADRLAARCRIGVVEASTGMELRPGQAVVAPGDFHMIVEKHGRGLRVRTHQGPPENSCRPAVDVLFRSVAEVFGPHSLAVIMTGMGQDGLRGCERIHEAGGQILAQDEATSVVWGMPGFVANAGLANKVLPLGELAPEIVHRANQFRGGAMIETAAPFSRMA